MIPRRTDLIQPFTLSAGLLVETGTTQTLIAALIGKRNTPCLRLFLRLGWLRSRLSERHKVVVADHAIHLHDVVDDTDVAPCAVQLHGTGFLDWLLCRFNRIQIASNPGRPHQLLAEIADVIAFLASCLRYPRDRPAIVRTSGDADGPIAHPITSSATQSHLRTVLALVVTVAGHAHAIGAGRELTLYATKEVIDLAALVKSLRLAGFVLRTVLMTDATV
jgi:hypothetical protein